MSSLLPPSRWTRPLLLSAAATLALIAWTLFVRASGGIGPFPWNELGDLSILPPYSVGLAAQEIVVPLVLLYLFSRTALFRRVIIHHTEAQDDLRLFGMLALFQGLSFLYYLRFAPINDDWVTTGAFWVLVAGFLGGWPMGLAIGLLTAPLVGLVNYWPWLDPAEPFSFSVLFEFYILKDMEAMSSLWMGVVSGLFGSAWGNKELKPTAAAIFTAVVISLTFLLTLVSVGYPQYFIERWLPNVTIVAAAMVLFVVMVRYVQDEVTRQQAEVARLELSQANLNLTQTRLALAQAEIRALHAQINPHFFFNTLNTIRYFVRTDPDIARDLLIRLSEIFQRALHAGEFVTLQDEINYVEAYLTLEKARLDDRLRVIWTNLARNCLEMPVPTLVLQPLVENAVVHGISSRPEGGTLHIILNQTGGDLLVQIDDDGPGFDGKAALLGTIPDTPDPVPNTDTRPSHKIGLRNVDERLRLLYGDPYGLLIESTPGQGARVMFRIPLASSEQ